MSNVKICDSKKITKLNQYFYINDEGNVLKYKKYCIIHHCKKVASFDHHKEKIFL